jgi:ABC-type polysaccharide transport system permease subunit
MKKENMPIFRKIVSTITIFFILYYTIITCIAFPEVFRKAEPKTIQTDVWIPENWVLVEQIETIFTDHIVDIEVFKEIADKMGPIEITLSRDKTLLYKGNIKGVSIYSRVYFYPDSGIELYSIEKITLRERQRIDGSRHSFY